MQIQIKKQLKIELDQADIVEAVGDYLIKHGQKVNAEALAEINFVKSPKDGLRASLNLTEESGTEAEVHTPIKGYGTAITTPPSLGVTAEAVVKTPYTELDEPTTPVLAVATPDPQPDPEEPTEQGPSEDVMPSLDDIKAAVESNQPEPESTTEFPVEEQPTEERKSLFGSSGFL